MANDEPTIFARANMMFAVYQYCVSNLSCPESPIVSQSDLLLVLFKGLEQLRKHTKPAGNSQNLVASGSRTAILIHMQQKSSKPRSRRWVFGLMSFTLLGVIGVGWLVFEITKPSRVRAAVIHWLDQQVDSDFKIGEVTFQFPAQLEIAWLHIGGLSEQEAAIYARLRDISLMLTPGELISGNAIPQRLTVAQAELYVPSVIDTEDQSPKKFDQARLTQTLTDIAGGFTFPVEIQDCDLALYSKIGPNSQIDQRWSFDVTFGPSDTSGLAIDVVEKQSQKAAAFLVEPSGACSAAIEPIDLKSLHSLLETIPAAQAFSEKLHEWEIQGQLRMNATRAPSGEMDIVGTLTHGALTIPIEADPQTEHYAAIDSLTGQVLLHDQSATIDMKARMGAADLSFRAEMASTPESSGLANIMQWPGEIRFTASQLDLPTHGRNPLFVDSPNLPQRARTLFDEFLPQGIVDLDLHATHKPQNDEMPWNYVANITSIDSRCVYYRFPYPIDRISGGVTIENGRILFRDFVGHYGDGRIFTYGEIFSSAPSTGFDLHFQGVGLPLDQNLYEAIPASQQQVWDKTQLSGLIDIDLRMRRPNGTPESGPMPAETDMKATLRNASLAFADSYLQHADAHFLVQDGKVIVNALDALSNEQATLSIRGQSSIDVEQPAAERWSILADKHQLTMRAEINDLLAGSGRTAAGTDAIPPISATLILDAVGDLQIDGDTQERRFAANIKRGQLQFFDPTRDFDISSGRVVVENEALRLIDLRCDSSCGRIELSGPVKAINPNDPLRVHLTAPNSGDSVSSLLDSVVPPRWREEAGAFALRGATDIAAEFRVVENALNVDLTVTAASAQPRVFPLLLRNVSAQLLLQPDGFVLREAHGSYADNGRITVKGRGQWDEPSPETELSIRAQNVPLTNEFIDAFPGGFAQSLHRLTPSGTLEAAESGINISTTRDSGWQVAGKLNYNGPRIDLGLELINFVATIQGQLEIASDGDLSVDAKLNIERGTLADREITDCSAGISNEPDSPWILLRDISGRMAGGEVRGSVDVEPKSGAYRAELMLHQLNFDQFVGGKKEDTPQTNARVDGRIYVEGIADRISTRAGRGELRITAPPVDRTPVLSSVADASRQTPYKLPANADEIRLAFDWKGSTLFLTYVEIDGSPLRLVGRGQWNMATDAINLTLISAPLKLPASPLRDLLDIAGEELVQYRVSGTAKNPSVKLEPLYNMTGALRELLEPLVNPKR